jgi:hypothetical protein
MFVPVDTVGVGPVAVAAAASGPISLSTRVRPAVGDATAAAGDTVISDGWMTIVHAEPPAAAAAWVNAPGSSDAPVSCLEPPPNWTFVAGNPPVPLFAAVIVE